MPPRNYASNNGKPTNTDEEVEAKRLQKVDEENKRYLSKARAHLRLLEDGELEEEGDTQDRRVNAIRETVRWASLYMEGQQSLSMAVVNYRVAKAMSNKSGIEAAENQVRDAMKQKDIAEPELKRLLPQCHLGLISQVSEFHPILFLPKAFRNLIGLSVAAEDATDEDGVRLSLPMALASTGKP